MKPSTTSIRSRRTVFCLCSTLSRWIKSLFFPFRSTRSPQSVRLTSSKTTWAAGRAEGVEVVVAVVRWL